MLMMNTLVLISDRAGLMPVLFFIVSFLSARGHKAPLLVLTISNRIVRSQNS